MDSYLKDHIFSFEIMPVNTGTDRTTPCTIFAERSLFTKFDDFQATHLNRSEDTLSDNKLQRMKCRTQSIAVGSRSYIEVVKNQTGLINDNFIFPPAIIVAADHRAISHLLSNSEE